MNEQVEEVYWVHEAGMQVLVLFELNLMEIW